MWSWWPSCFQQSRDHGGHHVSSSHVIMVAFLVPVDVWSWRPSCLQQSCDHGGHRDSSGHSIMAAILSPAVTWLWWPSWFQQTLHDGSHVVSSGHMIVAAILVLADSACPPRPHQPEAAQRPSSPNNRLCHPVAITTLPSISSPLPTNETNVMMDYLQLCNQLQESRGREQIHTLSMQCWHRICS